MANTVVLKRSAVANRIPTTSDLALGELALNTNDGNLFFKRDVSGTQSILSVATLTGTQTLTNKTLTSPTISGGTINNAIIGGSTPAAITGTTVTSTGNLISLNSSGDEGGEILLAKPVTNSTIAGTGVTIDVWQNRLRIFEQGGTARGVFIDITAASAGVATNLVASGGTTTNALTIGTGLSGTSFNGSSAVTIAIDSTVATLTGTQTLTNKTLTSPTINSGALSGTFTGAPTFSDTTASTSSTTGAVKIGGGLGVVGNIYVGSASKVGYVNASNVSVVYQYYNAATNSLDTVFG